MYSVMVMCSKIVMLIYSLIAGQTFDLLGRSSPFVIMGILDILCAVLVIYYVKTGRLKDS